MHEGMNTGAEWPDPKRPPSPLFSFHRRESCYKTACKVHGICGVGEQRFGDQQAVSATGEIW